MSTPLEIANLGPVFGEIMRRHRLRPEHVDRTGTSIHIYNTGSYKCQLPCDHRWQSRFSWATFDLREQTIAKKWKMRCMYCDRDCLPNFSMPQLKGMYEKAVTIYMKRKSDEIVSIGNGQSIRGQSSNSRARRQLNQPHPSNLCEKCRWGAMSCWAGYHRHDTDDDKSWNLKHLKRNRQRHY